MFLRPLSELPSHLQAHFTKENTVDKPKFFVYPMNTGYEPHERFKSKDRGECVRSIYESGPGCVITVGDVSLVQDMLLTLQERIDELSGGGPGEEEEAIAIITSILDQGEKRMCAIHGALGAFSASSAEGLEKEEKIEWPKGM